MPSCCPAINSIELINPSAKLPWVAIIICTISNLSTHYKDKYSHHVRHDSLSHLVEDYLV
ncbi:hypothetical protein [Eubacterium aggregans]|uniref:hypothetical protein n=1 Tax=Eubacterium aggregans TaxID=81409 RepID=UPI003F6650E2